MIRIVMCCFMNRDYLEEANLSIQSIRRVGKFQGKITLITDFADVHMNEYDIDIHVVPPVERIEMGAGYRLKMLDLLNWESSDIFLYLDTDVLCVNDMKFFINHAMNIDDKLHVYGLDELGFTQRTHPASGHFASSLTNDPKICNQPAWSSGILLFRPSQKMMDAFCQTHSMYTNFLSNHPMYTNEWEQRFLCYIFCDMEYYNISLNPFVCEEYYRYPASYTFGKRPGNHLVLNHFCGLRGHRRKQLMQHYLDRIIGR